MTDRTARRTFPRRALCLLVLLAPLVAAAVWAALAPSTAGRDADAAGRSSDDPVAAALDQASAQSAFAVGGSRSLEGGTRDLSDGAEKLRTGSRDLASGMDRLQSGIGEAGRGATQISGGVDTLVGGVRGVAVIQGQVSTAIDDALGRLKGDDPDVVRTRQALTDLKNQLATQGLNQDTLNRLDQLKTGANELARQLSAPGAPLRDGVYQATKGSHDVRDGAAAVADGAKKANEGSSSVAGATDRTGRAISSANRARAAETGDTGAVRDAAADEAAAQHRRTSASVLAVAAATVVGALLLWLRRRPATGDERPDRVGAVLGVVVLSAAVAAFALSTAQGLSTTRGAVVAGLVTLSVVASVLLWRALVAVCGPTVGRILAVALAAAQVALVWWVWVVGTAPVSAWTVAGGTPLGHATAALDSALLGGGAAAMWTGAAVLGAVAVAALLAERLAPPPVPARVGGPAATPDPRDDEHAGAGADTDTVTDAEATSESTAVADAEGPLKPR